MKSLLRSLWSAVGLLGLVACGPVDESREEVARREEALEAGCTQLGPEITEHTCQHAVSGPYGAVTANSSESFSGTTPNINTTHTYYTVTLPSASGGYKGTVRFVPSRTGSWAFFTAPNVPVKLTNASGTVLTAALQHTVTAPSAYPTCALQNVTVYDLTQNSGKTTAYFLTLGTASVSSVGVVAERVEEYRLYWFQDADADTYGNPNVFKLTACTPPSGYVTNDTDCNDANSAIRPGATEICGDGVDNNCDGTSC